MTPGRLLGGTVYKYSLSLAGDIIFSGYLTSCQWYCDGTHEQCVNKVRPKRAGPADPATKADKKYDGRAGKGRNFTVLTPLFLNFDTRG